MKIPLELGITRHTLQKKGISGSYMVAIMDLDKKKKTRNIWISDKNTFKIRYYMAYFSQKLNIRWYDRDFGLF